MTIKGVLTDRELIGQYYNCDERRSGLTNDRSLSERCAN
jgi:hypothetical protein